MAIKKTTAVKKSDPPKKKYSPNAMIPGKDFGKAGSKGTYYYMEGVSGGGQGPLRNQKDMPSLDPKKTIRQLEKELEFQRSLLPGVSVQEKMRTAHKRYAEAVRAQSNAYKGAKAVAESKPYTLAKRVKLPGK